MVSRDLARRTNRVAGGRRGPRPPPSAYRGPPGGAERHQRATCRPETDAGLHRRDRRVRPSSRPPPERRSPASSPQRIGPCSRGCRSGLPRLVPTGCQSPTATQDRNIGYVVSMGSCFLSLELDIRPVINGGRRLPDSKWAVDVAAGVVPAVAYLPRAPSNGVVRIGVLAIGNKYLYTCRDCRDDSGSYGAISASEGVSGRERREYGHRDGIVATDHRMQNRSHDGSTVRSAGESALRDTARPRH